jgi:hypothetical protein
MQRKLPAEYNYFYIFVQVALLRARRVMSVGFDTLDRHIDACQQSSN